MIVDWFRPLSALVVAAWLLGVAPAFGGDPTLAPMPEKTPAPEFALSDPDGAVVKLSDLKGKVVIVNFWATWCPPCRQEMPSLQRAWNKIKKDGGHVVAIHVGGKPDEIWDFMSRDNLNFPVLLDKDSSVIKKWPVKGLPTTFVLDREGRLRYQAVGGREWDDPAILDVVMALR